MSDVIDQLLDELQRAGVFASATRGGVHYPDYFKEKARPIIAKYLTASSGSSLTAAIKEKLTVMIRQDGMSANGREINVR